MTTKKNLKKPILIFEPRYYDLSELEKTLIEVSFMNLKLIPMSDGLYTNVSKAVRSMNPEDARILKRKFRKFWRRLVKAELAKCKTDFERLKVSGKYGLKFKSPLVNKSLALRGVPGASHFAMNRKNIIYDYVWNMYVTSLLQRL